ncbi:FAD-dependent oxidoreductase [Sphingomonadales bacterium 56]|uniref:FAD/NAD(P)-binding protein n=1 Tax=unclassified Sphingobium TaxID=2611147 RepID=UPI001917F6EF|nr:MULTISPECIES: FAD/NAD(P)-binding protein [unclassified Sphingobium]MBY2928938.1 FAD-dependent oxidoreductase [Sphingomonadales bacterium 56]MBY2959210.1 FAD-dependent oxidoreductase [Sphingomonadales bacterium 58]CAD7338278.1 hypothetical protein SPHS6_01951 [Sphingobium sp. S6]CAD7338691.1 hypothetical protein SPHS8_02161 [Sphingobium sp. S8]
MLKVDHAVVIGGGFSGTLLAINLLRHGSLRVTIIEKRADRLGRGLAYGAAQEGHILNVRAANMSALPDQPGHFVEWLKKQGMGGEGSFAIRRDYGAYLCALLQEVSSHAQGRLTALTDDAVDLLRTEAGVRVMLRSGSHVDADVAALAPGNLPPHDMAAFSGINSSAYVNDPWAQDVAEGLQPADEILLLGSGLTAVDCALSLENAGFRGRITAHSRRGLAPHDHRAPSPYPPRNERPTGSLSSFVRQVRTRSTEIGWRGAVDELRPFIQDMWRAATTDERSRFLRHLRPYWDVHRHRIAPQVAERLGRMRADGRLQVRAGTIVKVVPEGASLVVSLRARGQTKVEALHVARAINCTGPLGDLHRTREPLLQRLAERGDIRPDPLSIGIDVDRQCRAIASDGTAQPRLFVVGPMTRGAHWEIVAVPDIRGQVWALAREITGAHWVEAEGL